MDVICFVLCACLIWLLASECSDDGLCVVENDVRVVITNASVGPYVSIEGL